MLTNLTKRIIAVLILSAASFSLLASESNVLREQWISYSNQIKIFNEKSNLSLNELREKNDLLTLEYKARAQYLNTLASDYLEGIITSQNLDKEFKQTGNYQQTVSHFSVELLILSIERLKSSRISEIKAFIKKYDSRYPVNSIPLFRLSGAEIKRESPTTEKGGFHRGNQSIFMDITRTTNDEWLFVLLHELYHALDENLYKASIEFSNSELMESIKNLSRQNENLVELNSFQNELLDKWVLAGLNRGLFAEYRAWNFGFSIYEKGINEGLWKKIPFIEEVLSYKDKNESMSSFTYRYLNERSKLSLEGFLGRAIILEKIKEKREAFKPN